MPSSSLFVIIALRKHQGRRKRLAGGEGAFYLIKS